MEDLYVCINILVQMEGFCKQLKSGSNHTVFFAIDENMVGKGENAGNQHFLLILQCF